MKVKMLETVQGRDISGTLVNEGIECSILTPGDDFIVSESLGEWLVENGKAEQIKTPVMVTSLPPADFDKQPPLEVKAELPKPVTGRKGRK